MSRINENTVKAEGQVSPTERITVRESGANFRILFIGNSITRHEPAPHIGWYGNWGMAASCEAKDYVHVAVAMLEKRFGAVDYMYVNASNWERQFWDEATLAELQPARDFEADVVVIRIGENMWGVREELEKRDALPYFKDMVKFFVKKPSAKVIVTDLFWANELLDGIIRATCRDCGYTLVQIGDLGTQDENMAIGQFEHHGVSVHPCDLGMQRIAERIVAKI